MTASWMISGLVLKSREYTELGIAQKLISGTLSGKVVYSDNASNIVGAGIKQSDVH